MGHLIGRENFLDRAFREELPCKEDFPHGPSCRVSFPRSRGALFVADMREERCDDADAVVDPALALLFIRLEVLQQFLSECGDCIREVEEGVEKVEGKDRLHDVQFELPVFDGQCQGKVIPNDLVAGLVEDFGNDRIDFAWHDRGTGLAGGHLQFIEAAARAGCHETDVIGNLDEGKGNDLERAGDIGKAVCRIRRVDQVVRCLEGEAGQPGKGFPGRGGCIPVLH